MSYFYWSVSGGSCPNSIGQYQEVHALIPLVSIRRFMSYFYWSVSGGSCPNSIGQYQEVHALILLVSIRRFMP